MDSKFYLFEFNYGRRTDEKEFIIKLLNKFDSRGLSATAFFVGNNPYNLKFYFALTFEQNSNEFDKWLIDYFPLKKFDFKFNYHLEDLVNDTLGGGFNFHAFKFIESVEMALTPNANVLFKFDEYETIKMKYGFGDKKIENFKIFLSHSSKDKKMIDEIYFSLQKAEIKVWYDKYEIEYGDSISDKINDGLKKSDLGLIILSKNFLASNWAKNEMNYFIQRRINESKTNLVYINLDLQHSEIPPLLQDLRYIDFHKNNWEEELMSIVRRKASS